MRRCAAGGFSLMSVLWDQTTTPEALAQAFFTLQSSTPRGLQWSDWRIVTQEVAKMHKRISKDESAHSSYQNAGNKCFLEKRFRAGLGFVSSIPKRWGGKGSNK
eukprot:142208-Pyramimonas_sp.AAC.1